MPPRQDEDQLKLTGAVLPRDRLIQPTSLGLMAGARRGGDVHRDGGQTNQAAGGTDVMDQSFLLHAVDRNNRPYDVHDPEQVDIKVTLNALRRDRF
jgi:hypothetical protein